MLFGQRLFALGIAVFLSLWATVSTCYAWGFSPDSKAQGLAHYIMAVCHDINGEDAQAISEYQKSIKFDGLESAPRLKLGAYYLRLDQINEATNQFKAVTRISPEESQAHYLLALIYSSEHKSDLAASEYEGILKNAPQDRQAISAILDLLGASYADRNHSKAIEAFRRALQLDPSNSEALNSLGYVYAEDGIHLDEAIGMIQKAIKIDPANGAYYDSLGWALYKKGNYKESLVALHKAHAFIEDKVLNDHIDDVLKALKQVPQKINGLKK